MRPKLADGVRNAFFNFWNLASSIGKQTPRDALILYDSLKLIHQARPNKPSLVLRVYFENPFNTKKIK